MPTRRLWSPMSAATDTPRRLTVADIAKRYADGERLPMLTAYDFPTAQILDEAGIPLLLVGDSLGQVLLGYESTVRVTMTEMLHHTRAVVRGAQRALVIGDMPFLSYATVGRGARERRPVPAGGRRAGGQGRGRRPLARGSSRRSSRPASRSWATSAGRRRRSTGWAARSRSRARTGTRPARCSPTRWPSRRPGAFAIVLELVPAQLAAAITERLRIPTIGIGAGAGCSGQVQVITDLLGLGDFMPRHARPLRATCGRRSPTAAARTPRTSRRARSRATPRRSAWTTRSSTRSLGRGAHDRAGRRRSRDRPARIATSTGERIRARPRPRDAASSGPGRSCAPRSRPPRARSASCRRWAGCTTATGR